MCFIAHCLFREVAVPLHHTGGTVGCIYPVHQQAPYKLA